MTDNLYSIGETAEILNIPVSMLRHYDKLGLVKPAVVDKKTGYRYYSLDQFHYIDRVKYLQKFDLSLAEIRDIMQNGKSEHLLPYLENKKQSYIRQIAEIHKKKELLEWYIQYFSYHREHDSPYEAVLPERHAVSVPYKDEIAPVSSDIKLLRVKNLPGLSNLHYKRQWGCALDYCKMLRKEFSPLYSFVFLADIPQFTSKHFKIFPQGVYLCFQTKLFENDFSKIPAVKEYFRNPNIKPGIVVAIEYEDNFHEYSSALYEVQIEILYI